MGIPKFLAIQFATSTPSDVSLLILSAFLIYKGVISLSVPLRRSNLMQALVLKIAFATLSPSDFA